MAILLQSERETGLDHESKLVYQQCIMERLQVVYFTLDDLQAGIVDVSDVCLGVGSVDAIKELLTQVGKCVPPSNYYPQQLDAHLHRALRKGTVADIKTALLAEREVFAKSVAWKRLTGQVFSPLNGWSQLQGVPDDLPVWLGEPVTFLSEYRVYVIENEIIHIANYMGDDRVVLDMEIIGLAVHALSEHSPKAYAMDWGVLATGETALVEVNDAWSIGAYPGISSKDYYIFLKTRWRELTQTN